MFIFLFIFYTEVQGSTKFKTKKDLTVPPNKILLKSIWIHLES